MWLQRNHPEVFAQLQGASATLGRLSAIYRGSFARRTRQAFGDYADYVSAAGSDVAYAASAVPDFTLDQIDVTAPALDAGPSLEQSIADETAGAASLTPDISSSVPTVPVSTPTAAASSLGQTLSQNAGLITATLNAANTIVTTKAAAQVIQAQAQRAAAGLAPANVSYTTVTDPTTGEVSAIPVLNTATGQLPLSTAGIDQLAPATFLQNYGLYILLGLAALVVATE
jgi:hypothetical protein